MKLILVNDNQNVYRQHTLFLMESNLLSHEIKPMGPPLPREGEAP